MSDFTCVVAADRDNGIGKDNDLPWPKLPADLAHFRRVTSEATAPRRNAALMGRRTWDSIPPRYRPLPARWNVVISRSGVEVPDGVGVAGSLDEAIALAEAAEEIEGVFVVGGGQIFGQAFAHPRCGQVYLTRIDARFECDAFIPDVREGFTLAETLAEHEEAGLRYRIERWVRRR